MPTGIAPGAQTNYTQDLFFSMERLSVNPYVVERIHPESKELPFMVEDSVVSDLTNGMNLKALHAAGRLFFADHSYQAKYPKIKGKYAAACSAYFFIHPMTGDFLPLAIRTNVESDLIYTPLDAENDWLLAKMMFNMNDLFHGQIFHLANSHAVSEAVHQAALRTLSEMHPVRAFLDRSKCQLIFYRTNPVITLTFTVMYQAYAIRPVGEQVLFNPGGFFDQTFFLSNEAVRQFATEYYPLTAGAFQANYFHQDLISRGLISCSYGPALKSLPYYEDASAMVSTLSRFTESYLRVYYPSEDFLAPDHELQSWIVEASTAAKVLDFPNSPLISRDVLTSILVHVAYLNGVSHHSLNSGTPASTSGVLPFHPAALHAPLPKTKGTIDTLMPFLANMTDALGQITLLIRFNRPKLEEANGNLVHMFSGSNFLGYGSAAVTSAAKVFENEMLDISNRIMSRVFDERGLAQGMPFIWRSLDPRKIPFFLSV